MFLFSILRKIFLILAPSLLYYLLKKSRNKSPRRKPTLSEIDKSKIVEGEIIQEKK